MKRPLRPAFLINLTLAAFIFTSLSINAQTAGNELAFNSEEHSMVPTSTDNPLANITSYTNVPDVSIQSYFSLVGSEIFPYMQIADAGNNFNPEIIESGKVKFFFTVNAVNAIIYGETYSFEITNVEQYHNTADKCLIKSKVEIELKAQKVDREKISSLAIYIDSDNHISFIELGNTEYYLRP